MWLLFEFYLSTDIDNISSLVSYTKISPNKNSPRNHAIDRITPHCVVGQLSAESICGCFTSPSRQASCNYGIGYDGRISLCVEEKDRSWCSSSSANDHRAVTIECASDKTHPYAMTNAVYASLINLCVDICKRNGKKKLLWFGDKNKTLAYSPKSDEMVLTVHRWFANKSCPGDWLYSRMGDLAAKVTARLGGSTAEEKPASTTTLYRVRKTWADSASQKGAFSSLANAKACADKNPGYKVFDGSGNAVYPAESKPAFSPYRVKVTASVLNIRKGAGTNYALAGTIRNGGIYTIVQESTGQGATKWGKLKSGAGWISLDYATKTGTSSSTASKAVTVGSTVTIQAGAVYGGLATSRGAKVPDYVSGKNRRYTVKQIATHKGVQEALLKEITSWVALSYLTVV